MKRIFLLLIFISLANVSFGQIYFETSFEDDDSGIDDWGNFDADGDGNIWEIGGQPHNEGGTCASSASWIAGVGAVTPDNYLVSPAIDLEDAIGNVTLEYWVRAQDPAWTSENYSILVSTVDGTVEELTTLVFEETLPENAAEENGYHKRSVDLSAYTGEFLWIAWRHHNCSDLFRLNLDDVIVFANDVTDAGVTAVGAPNNTGGCALTSTEDVTITVNNYSGAEITGFDVSYSIDGGAAVTETFTGTIAASGAMEYTFAQTADLSALGYYTITGSVSIADDSDDTNNSFDQPVTHGDASLEIEVQTDNQGGQHWRLVNSAGDTIARYDVYQWDITETTTVCLLNDDCYTFIWQQPTSGNGVSVNTVTLTYNGTEINQTLTEFLPYEVYPIGGACAPDDLACNSVNSPGTMVAGSASISGEVRNLGSNPLTSFDVVYSVDGGTESAVYSVTGVNILSSGVMDFTHDVAYDFPAGAHEISITLSNPNGVTDPSDNNNTATGNLIAVNEAFVQVVVGEEATGTWCQWCPRGTVALKNLAHDVTDGTWIGIAVHNNDPMANTEYDAAIGNYIGGYPSGAINRAFPDVDPGNFPQAYGIVKDFIPLAKVVVDTAHMEANREVTVEVNSIYALDMSNISNKLSLIVVENGLSGTGNDWNQVNAYNNGGPDGDLELTDWEGFDWTTAGNPVSGLTYDHVGREIIGGFSGVDGSVPADVTYNVANPYTFNFTLNADYVEDNVQIVALLLDENDVIINAHEVHLGFIIDNVEIGNPNDVKIFPNPTSGSITIESNKDALVKVYNMVGQLVYSETMNADKQTIDLGNLSNGTYFVEILDNNTLYSKKVIMTK